MLKRTAKKKALKNTLRISYALIAVVVYFILDNLAGSIALIANGGRIPTPGEVLACWCFFPFFAFYGIMIYNRNFVPKNRKRKIYA